MKEPDKKSGFQTHIPEPRWQQVVSVVGVLLIVIIYAWLIFFHR